MLRFFCFDSLPDRQKAPEPAAKATFPPVPVNVSSAAYPVVHELKPELVQPANSAHTAQA